MTNAIKKFLFKKFPYSIVNKNSGYDSTLDKIDNAEKLVNAGIINREEARKMINKPVDDLPDEMTRYTISTNTKFIDEAVVV
jgi:hypothetical protein